jgi:hypothetical protein
LAKAGSSTRESVDGAGTDGQLRPDRPVRRFDVFAEYNKLKSLEEGHPLDEAMGYGLWLAKVVASRRYSPASRKTTGTAPARADSATVARPDEKFRGLGDELQTDERFDEEIIQRMGRKFYNEVFAPAIARHFENGKRYESIRDSVRRDWKP